MAWKNLKQLKKVKKIEVLSILTVRILSAFGAIAVISWINWLVIRGWFGGAGPANLGSIEVSYVAMGRFLTDFGYKNWAPFWYFGFPFHLFYTPLLPFLEAIIHWFFKLHLWEAYRLITGMAYILAPVSVFFLGWTLSRRFIGGFLSGVLYSVAPTLFYFVLPATRDALNGEVAADRFSLSFWEPRRFTVLVRWGEGPHTLALAFLPLVGVFFLLSLRRKNFWLLVLAAIFLALTGLTNALGFMGAILLTLSIAFVGFAQETKERWKTVVWPALLFLLGFGLASFWMNLSFIKNFFAEGSGAASIYMNYFPWGWLGVGLILVMLYFLYGRVVKDWGFGAALIWFAGLFTVVYVYYTSAPAELSGQRIELLPQALRYMMQVDMAFCVFVGMTVAGILKIIGKWFRLAELILTVFLAVICLYTLLYINPYLTTSYKVADNVVNLADTREEAIANMLAKNVDSKKGERVFITGNYGFYLNWFTDVWQHRGALFQAATHPWPDHIHYQMVNGDDADIARYWLKAMNAKYAVVPTIESEELYKEVKNVERFEDFEKVYEKKGDIIFRVPLRRPSIAKAVSGDEMMELDTPKKADDEEALKAYVQWLERSSEKEADFEMIDHDNYKISGNVDEGEIVLVQMTADSGWVALNRQGEQGQMSKVRTGKDPLGFLLLYPDPGEFEINLKHTRSWQVWLGYLTSLFTVCFIVWYGIAQRRFVKKLEEANNFEKEGKKKESASGDKL